MQEVTAIEQVTAPDDPFGGTEVVQQLVADLPKAELKIVPEVGHWPRLHDPELAARTIEGFLGGRGLPSRCQDGLCLCPHFAARAGPIRPCRS